MPAIVSESYGFGQGHVEPGGPGDGVGHLRHLEGVGQPGALVVTREHKHLGLARQTPKGARMQDPVAVSLETSTQRVRILRQGPMPCAGGAGGARGEQQLLGVLAGLSWYQVGSDTWAR